MSNPKIFKVFELPMTKPQQRKCKKEFSRAATGSGLLAIEPKVRLGILKVAILSPEFTDRLAAMILREKNRCAPKP